jgi:hypothetical protein
MRLLTLQSDGTVDRQGVLVHLLLEIALEVAFGLVLSLDAGGGGGGRGPSPGGRTGRAVRPDPAGSGTGTTGGTTGATAAGGSGAGGAGGAGGRAGACGVAAGGESEGFTVIFLRGKEARGGYRGSFWI